MTYRSVASHITSKGVKLGTTENIAIVESIVFNPTPG